MHQIDLIARHVAEEATAHCCPCTLPVLDAPRRSLLNAPAMSFQTHCVLGDGLSRVLLRRLLRGLGCGRQRRGLASGHGRLRCEDGFGVKLVPLVIIGVGYNCRLGGSMSKSPGKDYQSAWLARVLHHTSRDSDSGAGSLVRDGEGL